jgi:hypothetical protein
MLTNPITDARAWRATTLDPRATWYYPLSERCRAALDETFEKLRQKPRPVTQLRVDETPCAACAEDLQPVRRALESGRGFAIIEGLPCERCTVAEQQAAYWLLGQLLGRPVEQNVQGTLLYDVRDTGQDVRYGARFSVTNAETGYHTDNSFGDAVVDYVGLLCHRPAKSGGENQVVSVYALHNELLARHADALKALYQPFHFDRRGGLRPGDAPTVQFPILHWDGAGLVCRYLRYWIEAGQDKSDRPLTAEQTAALAALEQVATEPALRAEFGLKPGDMFFVNNRWILHNRSAFADHDEPGRRRHYVRLWLEARGQVANAR